MTDPRIEANRANWDERVPVHVDAPSCRVAQFRAGGVFYIAEEHPLCHTLDYEKTDPLRFAQSYFRAEADRYDLDGTYAVADAHFKNTVGYEWQHTLGRIVTALCDVGLRIWFLHEFPFTFWKHFACLQQHDDGWWHVPDHLPAVPLMFSLMAEKPQSA